MAKKSAYGFEAGAKRGISRRQFLKQAAAVGVSAGTLGVFLSGCGNAGEQGGREASLRWTIRGAGEDLRVKILQRLAREFTEDTDVEVEVQPVAAEGYDDKIITQAAGGTAPDIIGITLVNLPVLASRGVLATLDERVYTAENFNYEDFFEPVREGMVFEGQTYGLPSASSLWVSIYNKDLFDQEGVELPSPTEPMGWEEFLNIARRFTKPDRRQYGLATIPKWPWVAGFLYSNGGSLFGDDASECALATPSSLEAMQLYVDLFTKDEVAVPVSNPSSIDAEAMGAFLEGRAAMLHHSTLILPTLVAEADFEFGFFPLPAMGDQSVSCSLGQGLAVNSDTEFPDQAWESVKYLTSADAQRQFAEEVGDVPTRESAFDAFEGAPPPPENPETLSSILSGQQGTRAVSPALPPQMLEFESTWNREILPMFRTGDNAKETITRFDQQIDELLAGA